MATPMRKALAGGRIFATTYGDPDQPRRVVAFPGWMHTVKDFDAILGGGLPTASAVAVDLPGFGGPNPEPPEPWGSADYARWAAPLLEGDDLHPPVVLVGHSRGGVVALHLAASHPDRVAALVLVAAPILKRAANAAKPRFAFRAAKALHRLGALSDARMEAQRQRHGSADYRAARGVMRDVLVKLTNESHEAQLTATACPIELVWGERDHDVPVEIAERAKQLRGDGVTLTVVPTGHNIPTEAPAAVRAAIERHL